jgi:hypothetical protein
MGDARGVGIAEQDFFVGLSARFEYNGAIVDGLSEGIGGVPRRRRPQVSPIPAAAPGLNERSRPACHAESPGTKRL